MHISRPQGVPRLVRSVTPRHDTNMARSPWCASTSERAQVCWLAPAMRKQRCMLNLSTPHATFNREANRTCASQGPHMAVRRPRRTPRKAQENKKRRPHYGVPQFCGRCCTRALPGPMAPSFELRTLPGRQACKHLSRPCATYNARGEIGKGCAFQVRQEKRRRTKRHLMTEMQLLCSATSAELNMVWSWNGDLRVGHGFPSL